MGQHMHLLSPPVIASVGSPKLLLEVADSTTLRALRPNLELIADWGRLHGVNGCYVYCKLADGHYEGRNFNHLDPAWKTAPPAWRQGRWHISCSSR